MAYKPPKFYRLPDGSVIPVVKPTEDTVGVEKKKPKAGVEDIAKTIRRDDKISMEDIMPWLIGGGSALMGHSIASSILDDSGSPRHRESVWSRALKTIARIGLTGAAGYGGYYLGKKLNEKSAAGTGDIGDIVEIGLPNGQKAYVPAEYKGIAEKVAPNAGNAVDLWDRALPEYRDSLNSGPSWHNFATGLEVGAAIPAGIGMWRTFANRGNVRAALKAKDLAEVDQTLAAKAIDAQKASPQYKPKVGPTEESLLAKQRADRALSVAEEGVTKAQNPNIFARAWPYYGLAAGMAAGGLASDYYGSKVNDTKARAQDLIEAGPYVNSSVNAETSSPLLKDQVKDQGQ